MTAVDSSERVDLLQKISMHLRTEDPAQALQYASEGLVVANDIEYTAGKAGTNRVIGIIHATIGNYDLSLDHFLKSLELYEGLEDTLNMARLENNIGILYKQSDRPEAALVRYHKSLSLLSISPNPKTEGLVYNNMGVAFKNLKEYDSALLYYEKSIDLNTEHKFGSSLALNYTNMGVVNKHLKNYDESLSYYRKSLDLYQQQNNEIGIAKTLSNMAEVMILENKNEEAVMYLKDGEEIADKLKLKPVRLNIYESLIVASQNLGQTEQALNYSGKYIDLNDTLHRSQIDQELHNLTIKQEIASNTQKLADLAKDNELQTAALEKANLKNVLLTFIIVFALLVLGGFTYIYQKKHEVNHRLANINTEIKSQKDMLQSALKELKDKNIELDLLNKEKNYLINVVAHDLRSPLNQIQGLAGLVKMQEEKLSNDQREYLSKIDDSISMLSDRINQILDVSAIDSNSVNINLEHVSIRELLQQTVDEFEKAAQEKSITINTNLNGFDPMVLVDKTYVAQVFENLIGNALKFSNPGTKVNIELRERDGYVVTEVVDEGPGILTEEMPKLFKKFQSLSAQPTNGESSTGLGLSIVKKYTEAMNGKVWCESEFGVGSKFIVEFEKVAS